MTQGVISETVTFGVDESIEGMVDLKITYAFPSTVDRLSVRLPESVQVDASASPGFVGNGDHTYLWDGDRNPAVLNSGLTIESDGDGTHTFVDTGEWAVVRCPPRELSWRYRGPELSVTREFVVDGEGICSSDGSIVYLGPHETYRHRAGGQSIRLVVPEAANSVMSPTEILRTVGHAASLLEVGGRNDSVLAIAVPTNVNWSAPGLQSGENGFWVRADSRVASRSNTWVHEYVHTRQEWDPHSTTRWLNEGTTKYYAALCTFLQGRITFDTFHTHISTTRDAGADLTDPTTWSDGNAHYTKGRRVVAGLDVEIKRRTDHARSFQEVFAYLNRCDELTHADFETAVATVVDEPMDGWIETYVRGPEIPNIPRDPGVFDPEACLDNANPPQGPAQTTDETGEMPLVEDDPVPETIGDNEGDDSVAAPGDGPIRDPDGDDDVGPDEDNGAGAERTDEPKDPTVCRVCGADISPEDAFCNNCGLELNRSCPICGRSIHGEEYCPECGHQVAIVCEVCGMRREGQETYCPVCGTHFDAPPDK